MSIVADISSCSPSEKQKMAKDLTVVSSMQDKVVEFKVVKMMTPAGCSGQQYAMLPYGYAVKTLGMSTEDDGQWRHVSWPAAMRVPLRVAQIEIMKKARGDIAEHGTTVIQVQPGAGKTVMALALAAELGLAAAVVVPRDPLVKQWSSTAMDFFGVQSSEMTVSGAFDQTASLVVCLGTRPAKAGTNICDIGTLIIDEAHMACVPSMVPSLLEFTPKYIIALTATLPRADGAHTMMSLIVGGTHGFSKAPERPYDFVISVVPIAVPEKKNVKGKLDYTSLCRSLSEDATYNQAIVDIIVEECCGERKRKAIVLSKLVAHAEAIAETVARTTGLKTAVLAGAKRKRYSDCQVLCGTVSKISVGFDVATFADDFDGTPPDMLILAHTIPQWQGYTQAAGRVMRATTRPIVYFMTTSGNSITGRHASKISPYVKRTGGNVVTVKRPPPSTLLLL